jgi:cytochrome c5
MSNEQEHVEEHASPIKTPKQLIVTVVLSFVVPIAVILLLVNMVTGANKTAPGSNAYTTDAINKRIAPVAGFDIVDATGPKVYKTGEQVFQAVCTACHTAGVAGAPKVGDNAAWGPRMKEGFDAMLNIALHGKGAMPPKGGNPALSDYEVARAVVYMANKSGGSFKEPAAPTEGGDQKQAAAAAPAAPASAAAPAAPAAQPAAPAPKAAAPAAAPAAPAAAPAAGQGGPQVDLAAGEKLYKSTCFACHGAGIAGAPKFGNKADWEPREKDGFEAMVQFAIQGKGAMPPKGGAANASDQDIRNAVGYMVNAAK